MTGAPALTIRAIRSVAVDVPMRHVLGTSQAAMRSAPLLLIDLDTEEGITGRFAEHIWMVVNKANTGYPLRTTVDGWANLPAPGPDAVAGETAVRDVAAQRPR